MINRYYIETRVIYEWNCKQQAYIAAGKTQFFSDERLEEMENETCDKYNHDNLRYFE